MTIKEEYEYSPVAGTELTTATYDAQNDDVEIQSAKMTSASAGPTNRKFLYIAACVANLTALVLGVTLGWTSPEIPKMKISHQLGNPLPHPLTKDEESWIGSLLPIGATLGPFIAGATADKIGRKNSLLLGMVPVILAFLLAAYATSVYMLYLVRLLCGFGDGIFSTVLPMYIAEIADDKVRDSLGSFMELFVVMGFLFSYSLGPYVSISTFNMVSLIVPCVFVVIFYMFIPKSPYYLVRKSKDEAARALMKLRSTSHEAIEKELDVIKATVDESLTNKASFMDIFKSKALTKALTLSVGLTSLQQFAGIDVVLYYAQDLFTDAGSSISGDISAIILAVVQIFANIAAIILVKKQGKRFLLILSAMGMAFSLGIFSVYFHLKNGGSDVSPIAWIPIVSLVSYITAFSIGFGPLPWAIMGELFPSNIKSAASTATAVICWFFAFLFTKYFYLMNELVGIDGSFGFFTVCNVGAAVFVYKCVPETSGRSLQEIQDILRGKSSLGNREAS